jgi:hypothetical protein
MLHVPERYTPEARCQEKTGCILAAKLYAMLRENSERVYTRKVSETIEFTGVFQLLGK